MTISALSGAARSNLKRKPCPSKLQAVAMAPMTSNVTSFRFATASNRRWRTYSPNSWRGRKVWASP